MQTLEPSTRRFSKQEYYQMSELGWFDGQRVELIDGEIIVMSPQKHPHFSALDRVAAPCRWRTQRRGGA